MFVLSQEQGCTYSITQESHTTDWYLRSDRNNCRVLILMCICRAEEGDLRLIEEAPIANWMTGLLQVFFEGSWSQVCGGRFEVADANVACRQLGFGAGTIVPQLLSDADLVRLQSTPVFPEIAITASGCTGSEERLVDCSQEIDTDTRDYFDYTFSRDCLDSTGAGLRIACVGTPGQGMSLRRWQCIELYLCHRWLFHVFHH